MQLYKYADEFQALLRVIEDNEGELSEETEVQLDAISAAFDQKIENVAKIVREREADVVKFKAEAERMMKHARTAESQARWLKQYLLEQMARVGVDRVEGDHLKVAIQNSPPSCIVDFDSLPEKFHRIIPERREADKKEIIKALKSGEEVPGAELIIGQHIRIR